MIWMGEEDVEFHQGTLWPYPTDACTQCGQHRADHGWDVGPDLFLWPVCPPCEDCGEWHMGPACITDEEDA